MNAFSVEDFQSFSKSQVEAVAAFATTLSRGWQEIATEAADYSKQAFATSAETVEKLIGAKSVETAMQIQGEFAKQTYDGFVARSTKINEIVAKAAGEAAKPAQSLFTGAARA